MSESGGKMASNETKRRYLDSRVSDRYVKKGVLSQKDLDAHLKALPDDEANSTLVQMDLHETELSSDDDSSDDE
jgi:hypothetical protein